MFKSWSFGASSDFMASIHRSSRISGKKGERIVYIRTLVSGKHGTEAGRSIDTVANTGQYL